MSLYAFRVTEALIGSAGAPQYTMASMTILLCNLNFKVDMIPFDGPYLNLNCLQVTRLPENLSSGRTTERTNS